MAVENATDEENDQSRREFLFNSSRRALGALAALAAASRSSPGSTPQHDLPVTATPEIPNRVEEIVNPLTACFRPDAGSLSYQDAVSPLIDGDTLSLIPAGFALGKIGRRSRRGGYYDPYYSRQQSRSKDVSRRTFLKGAAAVGAASLAAASGVAGFLFARKARDGKPYESDSSPDPTQAPSWVTVLPPVTPDTILPPTPTALPPSPDWFLPGYEPTPTPPSYQPESRNEAFNYDDPVDQRIINPYRININAEQERTISDVLTTSTHIYQLLREHVRDGIVEGTCVPFSQSAEDTLQLIDQFDQMDPTEIGNIQISCLDTISSHVGYAQSTDTPVNHFINISKDQPVPAEVSSALYVLLISAGISPTEDLMKRTLSLFYHSKSRVLPIVFTPRIQSLNVQSTTPFRISRYGFSYSDLDPDLNTFVFFSDNVSLNLYYLMDDEIGAVLKPEEIGPLRSFSKQDIGSLFQLSYERSPADLSEGQAEASYDTWNSLIAHAYSGSSQVTHMQSIVEYFADTRTDQLVHTPALRSLFDRSPEIIVQLLQKNETLRAQLFSPETIITTELIRSSWDSVARTITGRYQFDDDITTFLDISSAYYVLELSSTTGKREYAPLLALASTPAYQQFREQAVTVCALSGIPSTAEQVNNTQEILLRQVYSALNGSTDSFELFPGRSASIQNVTHEPWIEVLLVNDGETWTMKLELRLDLSAYIAIDGITQPAVLHIPYADILYGVNGKASASINESQVITSAQEQYSRQLAEYGLASSDLSKSAQSLEQGIREFLRAGISRSGFMPPPVTEPRPQEAAAPVPYVVDVALLDRWYEQVEFVGETECTAESGPITVKYYRLTEQAAEVKQKKRAVARYGAEKEQIDTTQPFHFVVHYDGGATRNDEICSVGYLRSANRYSVPFVVGRLHPDELGRRVVHIYELGDPTTVEFHTGGANTVAMGVEMVALNINDVQQEQLVAVAELITGLQNRFPNLKWIWGHMDQKWAAQQDPKRVGADNGGKPDPGKRSMKWLAGELQRRGMIASAQNPEQGILLVPIEYYP